jgi:integrase
MKLVAKDRNGRKTPFLPSHGRSRQFKSAIAHQSGIQSLAPNDGPLCEYGEPYYPPGGDTLVSEITAAEVDGWILTLHGKKELSASTITKILQTLRTLLDGAVKQGMIRVNPANAVEPLKISHKKRGVLTDDEVRGLLRWPGPFADYRVYAMNLLAFNTGLRMAEARGLLVRDVKNDHIVIQHSWEEGYGLKAPKFNQVRVVPVPRKTREVLGQVIRDFESETLVFYGKDKSTPLSKTYILNELRSAYVTMRVEADPDAMSTTADQQVINGGSTIGGLLRCLSNRGYRWSSTVTVDDLTR